MKKLKSLGFVALVFDEGFNYSNFVKDLTIKEVAIVDKKIFLVLDIGEEESGEFKIPLKYFPYVKLIITPESPIYSGIDGKKIMTANIFCDSKNEPLLVNHGLVDGFLKNYIIVEPDTEFKKLEVVAQRENSSMINCHDGYFGNSDDIFELCLSQKSHKLFDVPESLTGKIHSLFLKR